MPNVPPTRPASNAPTVLDPRTAIKSVVNLAVVTSIIVHLVAVVFLLGLVTSARTCVLTRYSCLPVWVPSLVTPVPSRVNTFVRLLMTTGTRALTGTFPFMGRFILTACLFDLA